MFDSPGNPGGGVSVDRRGWTLAVLCTTECISQHS